MKTFKNVCAQGDVMFIRVNNISKENLEKIMPENSVNIIAHSETGHHHVMSADTTELYKLPDSILDCLLVVNEPTTLDHLREFDTHETILFEPGEFKVTRQREYTPEGFRKSQD